jgi:adenylate cyclase
LLALWLDNHVSLDACLRASRTACAIQQRLAQHAHLQQLPTSCALHGGEFSLGHLGASGHFEFSPVGDMVNTVSRMEPFNRQLGTRIIVSHRVADVLGAAENTKNLTEFALRDLGPFSLRNKKETVRFYHLYQPGVNPTQNGLESRFAQALALYLQSPRDALGLFEALVAEFPQDGPSQYYLRQCIQALSVAAQ